MCTNTLHYLFPDPQAILLRNYESKWNFAVRLQQGVHVLLFESFLDAALWNAQLKFIIF